MNPKNKLTITDQEWQAAELFFKDPKNAKFNKMRRPRTGQKGFGTIKHSFLQVEGAIYALDNKQSKNPEGKYLGEGSYGKVSIVQNKEGENFALKVELAVRDDYRQNELNVMKKLGRLVGTLVRHGKMILRFKEQAEKKTHKKIYTVQKLIPGISLFHQLHFVGLTSSQKLAVAAKIIKAIDILHNHNIFHGDVKPENIMCQVIGDTIQIEFIDFGTSEQLAPGQASIKKPCLSGTPFYHAPEVSKHQTYGFAGDIYALGVLFKSDLQLELDLSNPEEAKLKKMIRSMKRSDPLKRTGLLAVYAQINLVLALQVRDQISKELAQYQRTNLQLKNLNVLHDQGELVFHQKLNFLDQFIGMAKDKIQNLAPVSQFTVKHNNITYALDAARNNLLNKQDRNTAITANAILQPPASPSFNI